MNKIEIIRKLNERGLTIIEDFNDLNKIRVKDKNGYKYVIRYSNVITLNQGIVPFYKSNPYTIDNIQIYLNKFELSSMILSKEFVNNTDYLCFRCNLCGEEYQRPWYRMQECKYKLCNKCQRNLTIRSQSKSFEEVKNIFKEYGYNILDKEYIKNSTPIRCEDMNGYRYCISLQNLQKGRSPRMFSWKYNFEDCEFNLNNFIKNNNLKNKLIEVYRNKKAKFQCECGNSFVTDVFRFISGEKRRCEQCTKKMSGLELKVMEFLTENKINFEYQYSYPDLKNKKLLPFDFYLTDYNTCIEVDGDQHFHCAFINDKERARENLKMVQNNDNKKEQYCIDNNIGLIRIPYWKIKNEKFKEILSQFINTD